MELNAENVNNVFMDCLFRDNEDTTNHIKSNGIRNNVGFHSERLKQHEQDIKSMLDCLPLEFHKDTGGGTTFLNACMDKNGKHWGEHINMEKLFLLGNALNLSKWLMPKEMWSVLPGGMPYVGLCF
jgi:hypothetical protein